MSAEHVIHQVIANALQQVSLDVLVLAWTDNKCNKIAAVSMNS